MTKLEVYFKKKRALIEKALRKALPAESAEPSVLHEAMRYAVLGEGKRIRPILTLAVSEMFGGKERDAIAPACAVELIHAYSLIHDDLPVMDNADMRRGRPSCHKQFGETTALLAGDALLTLAFEVLGKSGSDPAVQLKLVKLVAEAAGSLGMVGGQVLDLESGGRRMGPAQLDRMNRMKTGALIRASCEAGAISAGAGLSAECRISRFGHYLGFAFQVVDDIIDQDGYLILMGASRAREKAAFLIRQAKQELSGFGKKAEMLRLIAQAVLERKH